MTGSTVYLRSTDKDGRETYSDHRCWDREKFIRSSHEAAVKAGGKVEEITRDEFNAKVFPSRGRT